MTPLARIVPTWRVADAVHAWSTTRDGGVSRAPYGRDAGRDGGLNLATHVGDDPHAVAENRRRLPLHAPPVWLEQVHGCVVCDLDAHRLDAPTPRADAAFTTRADRACAILVADCMPILLADRRGRIVGAAHAGWRGVVGGVLPAVVAAMRARVPDAELAVWVGPCIGQAAFEIGPEVRDALVQAVPDGAEACVRGRGDRWHADLPRLAQLQCRRLGIADVTLSGLCTVDDPQRFYSYRRDGVTGRFAALIAVHQDDASS